MLCVQKCSRPRGGTPFEMHSNHHKLRGCGSPLVRDTSVLPGKARPPAWFKDLKNVASGYLGCTSMNLQANLGQQ